MHSRFASVAYRTLPTKMHSSAALSILVLNYVIIGSLSSDHFTSDGPLSMWELSAILRKILGSVQMPWVSKHITSKNRIENKQFHQSRSFVFSAQFWYWKTTGDRTSHSSGSGFRYRAAIYGLLPAIAQWTPVSTAISQRQSIQSECNKYQFLAYDNFANRQTSQGEIKSSRAFA